MLGSPPTPPPLAPIPAAPAPPPLLGTTPPPSKPPPKSPTASFLGDAMMTNPTNTSQKKLTGE